MLVRKMDPNDGNSEKKFLDGLEDLVTLPKLIDQKNIPIALGVQDQVFEVLEIDQQNQDHFLGCVITCYCFEKEDTFEYRELQFEQDLKNQESFIHRQEKRMLGGIADSANKMKRKFSQSKSHDSSPSESERKNEGRAEKRKQGSVASTSKSKGQGKKITPEEELADLVIDGRIEVKVERLRGKKFDVKVPSELSTIAVVKEEISGRILSASGDDVPVERIVLFIKDPAGAPSLIKVDDHLTLREINTHIVKLNVLPK